MKDDESISVEIDPITGRDPAHLYDPNCDKCVDRRWTVLLKFIGEFDRSRRLCADCAGKILEEI